MARKQQRRGATAVSITSASRAHSEEIRGREFRYVVSMGIRTLCFLLALLFMKHWVVWFFLAGAVFLPYIAVVIANAGAAPEPVRDDHGFDPQRKALGTGPFPYDPDR